ncbi:MAG: tetratricopeptide repeat protein [Pseudogulbenkiania sp.]|nr:tetratricopeptide repeat protein [Pseudogulbenkiania sp.]
MKNACSRATLLALLTSLGMATPWPSQALSVPEAGTVNAPVRDLPQRIEALLQRTRNNPDPRLYAQIEPLLEQFERSAPTQPQPKILRAWYDMSLHRFKPALAGLREVHRLGAGNAISYGLTSDALVETGEYEEAVRVTQQMLDRYPGLPALARAAHLRFLHDDLEGAIELYRAALVDSRADDSAKDWVRLQLAELYLHAGRPQDAEPLVITARQHGGMPASAMLARVRALQSHYDEAISLYLGLLRQLPNPEYAYAAYELARQTHDLALMRRQQQLLDGMLRLDTSGLYRRMFAATLADLPGRSAEAVELAQRELDARPDLYSRMSLAWALYRHGELTAAAERCHEALRLNTPDPLLRYQASVILGAAGETARSVRLREQALAVQPSLAGYEHQPAGVALPVPAGGGDARN